MYSKTEWAEIAKLRHKIEKVGFKEGTFFRDEPKGPFVFYYYIRIYDITRRKVGKAVPFRRFLNKASHEVFELAEDVDEFLWEVSEIIWQHKQVAEPEAGKRMLQMDKKNILDGTRDGLQNRGYGKKAIEKAICSLQNDLDKRLDKFKNTPNYKYFVQTSPKSHSWIDRENEAIHKIRSLYKRHTTPPLSDRGISSSMAIVFAATDFWGDHKDKEENERIGIYFERLKKRLPLVANNEAHTPEVFDLPSITEH